MSIPTSKRAGLFPLLVGSLFILRNESNLPVLGSHLIGESLDTGGYVVELRPDGLVGRLDLPQCELGDRVAIFARLFMNIGVPLAERSDEDPDESLVAQMLQFASALKV